MRNVLTCRVCMVSETQMVVLQYNTGTISRSSKHFPQCINNIERVWVFLMSE